MLVRNDTLADCALKLELRQVILCNLEDNSFQNKILGDVMESLIGPDLVLEFF